jgi:ankyrin repeat protein
VKIKFGLELKLGLIIVIIFGLLLAVFAAWDPIKIKYYAWRLDSDSPAERAAAAGELLNYGEDGLRKIELAFDSKIEAEFLKYAWQNPNAECDFKGCKILDKRKNPHVAVLKGYCRALEILLAKGADKEIPDVFGQTPLFYAANCGSYAGAEILVRAGADLNRRQKEGKTALMVAAIRGDAKIAAFLISRGADVSIMTPAGETALHFAAVRGDIAMMKLLLESGAQIDAAKRSQRDLDTPLIAAIRARQAKAALFLIEKGASANCPGKYADTPLHAAAFEGFKNVVSALLREGADVNARNETGNTPLFDAHPETAALLLDCGADIEARNETGSTPLSWSISAKRGTWRLLLDRGASAQTADCVISSTPLHIAARYDDTEIIDALLAKGALINARNKDGWTPLLEAISSGSDNAFQFLLEKGADIYICGNDGTSALIVAVRGEEPEMLKSLLAEEYTLKKAGAGSNESLVLMRDNDGNTPAHSAIHCLEMMSILLKCGAAADEPNKYGVRPLHDAALETYCHSHDEADDETYNDELAVFKLLVAKGADVNARTNTGWSPLHAVAASENVEADNAAKILVEHGASVNAKTAEGWTPLMVAADKANLDVMRVIISAGADVHTVDNAGNTVLHAIAGVLPEKKVRFYWKEKEPVKEPPAKPPNSPPNLYLETYDTDDDDDIPTVGDGKRDDDKMAECAEFLIKAGANPDAPDCSGLAPLHLAAIRNSEKLIKFLVANGADVEKHYPGNGATPLHLAAWNNTCLSLDMLLYIGAAVDSRGINNETPLHYACAKNHLNAIKKLVFYGADVNARDKYRRTPLFHFGFYQETAETGLWFKEPEKSLKLLFDHGADINAVDNTGATPLMQAAWSGHWEMLKALLDNGADIRAKTIYHNTALIFAARGLNSYLVETLVNAGADVKSREWSNETAPENARSAFKELPWEERQKKGEALREIVRLLEPLEEARSSALENAMRTGELEKIILLLNESDLNAADSRGATALHLAARFGRLEIAEYLVGKGADVNCRAENGATPLIEACQYARREIVKLLLARGADANSKGLHGWCPLRAAAMSGDSGIARALLDCGADAKAKDEFEWAALHTAAKNGRAGAAELLIERGAAVDAKDSDGLTPLHYAVKSRSAETVKILLKRGADVNMKTKGGNTPLHRAVEFEIKDIVPILDYVMDNSNYDVDSPEFLIFEILLANDRAGIVEILVQAGADVNAVNNGGKTPLDLIPKEKRDSAIGKYLIARGAKSGKDLPRK